MSSAEDMMRQIAPVLIELVDQSIELAKKEAIAPLNERIKALEIKPAPEPAPTIDVDAIAKAAAQLVPVPEVPTIDTDAIAKSAAELIAVPEPQEVDIDAVAKAAAKLVVVPEPKAPEVDTDAIAKAAAALIEVPKPMPAPSIEEVAATFERRFSDMVLSWERQARDVFERAADKMPKPENGRDAVPLEGFDMSLGEDGRTVTVKMQAGDTLLEKSVKIPAVIDRGVYKPDGNYEKGDATSYGGCLWIAQRDAPEGVPGAGPDWRLSVKKGRDGKDLRESASRHDKSKGVSVK